MSRFRRAGGWMMGLGMVVLLGAGASAQVAVFQQPLPPGTDPDGKKDGQKTSQFSAVKLIENSVYRQYINVARDAIKDAVVTKDEKSAHEAWIAAVTALQKILDTPEDFYVQVREKDNAGREVLRWTSVKYEASN